jgi:hypothetical protein
VIEDFPPVRGVELEINVPENIKSVYQISNKSKLSFTRNGNKIKVKVPDFKMHTGIVFEY